jgi:HEAT repeat protein
MAKRLHKGDESHRRWKIIEASRSADVGVLPQLLARLSSAETYQNRRHIVRALSNIGGPQAEAKLLELLASERGPLLGEVAQAIGKLRLRQAIPALKLLSAHESEWVRQNVAFALGRLAADA